MGYSFGTIDYIAPEQIQATPVDGRADQYALGCVLYECLTGHVPFERDRDAAIIWAHVEDLPPLPSTVRPDLPAAVDEVFSRVLAKKADDRYPTCREFVEAADAALGSPVGRAASGRQRDLSHRRAAARQARHGRDPQAGTVRPARLRRARARSAACFPAGAGPRRRRRAAIAGAGSAPSPPPWS